MWRYIINTTAYFLSGSLIFLYLYYGESTNTITPKTVNLYSHILFLCLICGWSLFFIRKESYKHLNWQRNFASRFILLWFIYSFITFIIIYIYFRFVYNLFDSSFRWDSWIDENSELPYKLIIIISLLTFFYQIIDFVFFAYQSYSKTIIDKERTMSNQLSLQYSVLKNQLSPHFLFNSLNTISSLIYRDHRIASRFIRQLAEVFKLSLESHKQTLISLSKEIKLIEAYVYLLKVRFEGTLQFHLNIDDETTNTLIPPLSLQLLIENAIKHNHFSEETPLKIEIYRKKDKLIVRNNYLRKTQSIRYNGDAYKNDETIPSFKMGLNNIKSRYAYFSKREIIIRKQEYFEVELPLIFSSNA